jgi:hypothetical protein
VSSLAPRAEVIAAMETAVDAIAAEARGILGERLVQALSGRVNILPSGLVTGLTSGTLAQAFMPSPLLWQDLAALLPEQLKASLRACINSAVYQEGPQMNDRLAQIETLDQRISFVERSHAELVDAALQNGITIPYMEGERIRRLQAQQAADRQAREERQQSQRTR